MSDEQPCVVCGRVNPLGGLEFGKLPASKSYLICVDRETCTDLHRKAPAPASQFTGGEDV